MKLDILAFAAHPDDVELSASGTLMRYVAEGKKVGIVDLTEGELGTRGTVETRYEEAADASKIMGLSARENLRMSDGFFEDNAENKRLIIEQIRKYQPEIVLANSISDRHPDHGRAGKLVEDACFLAGLRKIETELDGVEQLPHRPRLVAHYIQDYYLEPSFVIDVTDYVERKIEVIKAFKTQFYDPNSPEPNTPISGEEFFDFIKGRMLNMGRPAGMKYAEGFTISRVFGVKDLFEVV
ncbi:MAG: bacillithiol biosynthesis deacetylase BshB1 [Flavobacteriales bacterium]|nr:bacillithiol biosynthesis deacetylase BshB1 [Flavobacteriales bacterium]